MAPIFLSVKNTGRPQILASEKDFLLVFKPPGMHTAPLAHSHSDNLFDWCALKFPEITGVNGRRAGEGGLLHRLDLETHGLILIARTQYGMVSLTGQQKEGKIIKEYSAIVSPNTKTLPGFPGEKPDIPAYLFSGATIHKNQNKAPIPFRVGSAFRPYGFGRKAVRPVLAENTNGTDHGGIKKIKDVVFDDGKPYVTEILSSRFFPHGITSLRLRIYRGFRHQIRCHLAWLGNSILNDSIYGGMQFGKGLLGLKACAITFSNPSLGKKFTYSLPPLDLDDI